VRGETPFLVVRIMRATALAAGAQSPLYYAGRVQWIAGSTMVLMRDEGWSLRVNPQAASRTADALSTQ